MNKHLPWAEIREKYESGRYSYRRLAEEYGIAHVTLYRRSTREEWQKGRQEKERMRLRECLSETARALAKATDDAVGRMAEGPCEVKEIRELARVLQAVVDMSEKLYRAEGQETAAAGRDTAVRVVMGEEVEELSE